MKSLIRLLPLAIAAVVATSGLSVAATSAAAPAAQQVCPVSGDELTNPVSYVYKQAGKPDRVIQFCCQDCIKDFEKDPAKYLAELDTGETAKPADGKTASSGACCADEGSGSVVKSYVSVSEALAADNFNQARDAAAALAKTAKAGGKTSVYNAALAVIHADSITSARQAFKALSAEVVPLAQGADGFVVMNCPMAKADWVQTDAKVRNPYYGKAMLTCGAPKTVAAK